MPRISSQARKAVEGIRDILVEAGVGVFQVDATNYATTDTAISFKRVYKAPDRLITLTVYFEDDAISDLWDREILIQVRNRGTRNPLDVDDLAEDIFRVLHGRSHENWDGMEVASLKRLSRGTLPPDENDRWQVTQNYQLITQRPRGVSL